MGLLEREIQDVKRFKDIVEILGKHGFGLFFDRLNLRSRIPFVRRHVKPRKTMPPPERVRKAFEELGPTFIKFGQIMSQRPDIIPQAYVDELEKLTDSVPAFPAEEARAIIEEDLGPVDEVFASFEDEPLAAASIAQVHKATLDGGEEVVVKVRRPGIEKLMKNDLDIMLFLAKQADKHIKQVHGMAQEDVEEFKRWTLDELNLHKEARNARRLQENLQDEERVKVPDVHMDLTTERVLVMEYVEGVKCNDVEALDAMDIDRGDIAVTAVRAGLKQVLRDGFFHADPHPSNFLINEDGEIIYLDFGMVGKLSKTTRRDVSLLILHAMNEDVDAAMDVITRMATLQPDADVDALKEEVEELMLLLRNATIEEQSVFRALLDITITARKYGITMPSSLAIVGKSLLTMEGIGLTVYPDFELTADLKRTVEKIIWRMNSPTDLARTFLVDVVQNRDLVAKMPSKLSKTLDGLSDPRIETTVKIERPGTKKAIIAGALVIASGLILADALQGQNLVYIAAAGLVVAFLLGVFK